MGRWAERRLRSPRRKPWGACHTEAFSNGWPNAPHRVLRARLEAAQAFEGNVVGEIYVASEGGRFPLERYVCYPAMQDATGAIEAFPHWAGESVGSVSRVQPAGEIVHELAVEAERLLRRWS